MPPVVHIVRHAEGYHDLPPQSLNAGIHDPLLTEKGKNACHDFRKSFPLHDQIDLLCSSALRRTIQTSRLCFEPVLQRGMKILILPDAQESNATPSNTGSPVSSLLKEFGEQIDTSQMTEYWYKKIGRYDPSHAALLARAHRLRTFLRDLEEREIMLVTHGNFAHYILGNVDECGNQTTRDWDHLEWRTFVFVVDRSADAELQETEDSVGRRKEPLTPTT